MRRQVFICLTAGLLLFDFGARSEPRLQAPLAGLAFLLGHWTSLNGTVADTGGTAKGSSMMTAAAGGAVLLRQDHTETFTAAGKPAEKFDMIMMVYDEGGEIHADYADGVHIIHYTQARIVPGRSVTFTTGVTPGAPGFSLGYDLITPGTLRISFAMMLPGQAELRPIATGLATRDGSP